MLVARQRCAAGDLLRDPGAAGRAVGHDRLGADLRDGGATRGTFLDHLRRDDQQPPAGGGAAAVAMYAARRIWSTASAARVLCRGRIFRGAAAANELPALAVLRAGDGAAAAGRRRGKRCWPTCRPPLVVAAAAVGHELRCPPRWTPALRAPQRTERPTTGTTTRTCRDGKVARKLLERPQGPQPIGASPRGPPMRCTRWSGITASFSLTPVWLLSVAGVAMLCARAIPRRESGAMIAVLVAGVPGVLPVAPADRSQLRRHDQRLSLDVLVRAAVARGPAAGRRSDAHRAGAAWRWCC